MNAAENTETAPERTNAEKVKSWKWRRTKAGLKQGDIARLSGKSVPQISMYETGNTEPSASVVDTIEGILVQHGV